MPYCTTAISSSDMSTPRKRTRDGCWTCKLRHQKCDGARPRCANCQQIGRECGGFEVRLQWGNGVASRGRLAGASSPVQAEADIRRPVRRGRQRDLQKDAQSSTRTVGAQRRSCDASLQNVLSTETATDPQTTIAQNAQLDSQIDLQPDLHMDLETDLQISPGTYTPTDLQAYDGANAWPPTPSAGDNVANLSPHSPDERALFQECEYQGSL
jgi:hypothetical protein